jgi:7-cyano-7-deazaguanine synthase in queuosine biosynthesis
MNLLEDLYKSNSCNRKGHDTHCGVCRNCLARRVAIKNANVIDCTKYLC